MSDIIDHEARRDIAKLWTALRELGSALWGDDKTRDNGIRSVTKAHEARLVALESDQRELRSELQHYLDKGREETCLGLKALAAHETECQDFYKEYEEEETEVKVAEIQAGAQVGAAKEQARGQVTREWVVVAGMALLVLKDFILPLVGAGK